MTNEELVAKIQAGERDRLPELWEQVERFVAKQSNQLLKAMGGNSTAYGLEFNDLYHSGYFALVDAVERYDPAAGCSFIGLLALHLKTEFAKTGGWYGKSGSRRHTQDPLHLAISMDAPVSGEDETLTLGNTIPDPNAVQAFRAVEEAIYRGQIRRAVRQALERLSVEERLAIKAHYYEGYTRGQAGRRALELAEMHLRRLLSNQKECLQ